MNFHIESPLPFDRWGRAFLSLEFVDLRVIIIIIAVLCAETPSGGDEVYDEDIGHRPRYSDSRLWSR